MRAADTHDQSGVPLEVDSPDKKLAKIVLLDGAYPPQLVADARLEAVTGDVSDAATVARVVTTDTGALFHLAAVVSGAAEADFDLGMRVNVDGTRALLEACPLDQAVRIANGLREAVRDFRFVWQDKTFGIGMSAGLVTIDEIGRAHV